MMIKKITGLVLTLILIFLILGTANAQVTLEAPQNLSVTLVNHEDGRPCFELKWTNPQSIEDLIEDGVEIGEAPMSYQIDYKVGNGSWDSEVNGNFLYGNALEANEYVEDYPAFDPIDAGFEGIVDIKSNIYQFRVRYVYYYCDDIEDHYIYGPFTNIVSIGTEAYQKTYSEASAWAVPELDKAAEYGFITEKIKNKMNGPITREEFAEIAVKLYEKTTGKQATLSDMNAFVDTNNPEVFKAYSLGIVAGTDKERKLFSPNELTNREQVATMLYRTIQAMGFDTDLSSPGSAGFNDQNMISGWALDSVKFMNGHQFIKGSGGNFDPKGTCTREMAVLIALRVYENTATLQN